MKRVNLVEYFELAENLLKARQATSASTNTGGALYFGIIVLPAKLRAFVSDDNGFSACKHVATQLADNVDAWVRKNLYDENGQFKTDQFSTEFQSYQFSEISRRIDAFKSVFEAESRDVDVYSVGQIGIYRTSALVSAGDDIIPSETREILPEDALLEFRNAGRCLAFDLPTACGFHALRGLELVMETYLASFEVDTSKFKSWNDYITAAKALSDDLGDNKPGTAKPSKKVATMLDRMRELDRNPLMHPRDTLDPMSADMLFKLSTITVLEMAKDMTAKERKAETKRRALPKAAE